MTVMTNNLLADWHLRLKFVDDMSAIEILPGKSAQFGGIWRSQFFYGSQDETKSY